MLQPFVDVASNRYILQIFENGDQTSWRFCDRDLFGMVKNVTLLRGESWPPTIGDEKVLGFFGPNKGHREAAKITVLAEKESGVEALPVLVTLPKTNGWNTSFRLGRSIFRCELLVSGRVFLKTFDFGDGEWKVENPTILFGIRCAIIRGPILWGSKVLCIFWKPDHKLQNETHHEKINILYKVGPLRSL